MTKPIIMVLGGAGYIGSHTVRLLNQCEYPVTVFDNLSTGHREAVPPEANFIYGDLLDKKSIDAAIKKSKPDMVVHFAAASQVGESMINPAKYYNNNVIGTINLLNSLMENQVKYIVFSSTAAVYGEPATVPITEENKCLPTNVYGRTKLMIENILKDFDQAYGLKYVCLRYFNACGADPSGAIGEDHDPETHLIPIIMQVISGLRDKLVIYGEDYPTADGTCVRDYVHVHDLAVAHKLALDYLLAKESSGIFNLGNGNGFSVKQIIEAVRKVTGIEFPYTVGARRAGDPATLVASSNLARSVLSWQPRYNVIEDIIQTAWKWHESNPQGYKSKNI